MNNIILKFIQQGKSNEALSLLRSNKYWHNLDFLLYWATINDLAEVVQYILSNSLVAVGYLENAWSIAKVKNNIETLKVLSKYFSNDQKDSYKINQLIRLRINKSRKGDCMESNPLSANLPLERLNLKRWVKRNENRRDKPKERSYNPHTLWGLKQNKLTLYANKKKRGRQRSTQMDGRRLLARSRHEGLSPAYQ